MKKGMTLRSRTRRFAGLLAVVPALALPATAGATTLFGSGSSAEQPILQVLFRGYSQVHHNIRFNFLPDGGNAGVKDVQAGRREFAVNTRPPLPSDSGTTQFKLFLDGLCVAVNPSNSVSNLTIAEAKNIFTGVDTSWTQVPGSNLTSTIDPIGSQLERRFLHVLPVRPYSAARRSHRTCSRSRLTAWSRRRCTSDKNAIGYVGLAHSGKGSGVKPVKLNGVACNTANIKNETYPLFRFIWGVLPTAHPSAQVENFIEWVRTSKAAGQIISRAGAVPAFNRQ